MREAVIQKDAAALHRAAHSLKSSSADIVALTLSALAKQGRAGSTEGAAEEFSKIKSEYERVKVALETHRRRS